MSKLAGYFIYNIMLYELIMLEVRMEYKNGLTQEQARSVGANFGGGMKMAATCGTVTGGLMVLGLMGIEDGPTIAEFQRTIRDHHSGCLRRIACSGSMRSKHPFTSHSFFNGLQSAVGGVLTKILYIRIQNYFSSVFYLKI